MASTSSNHRSHLKLVTDLSSLPLSTRRAFGVVIGDYILAVFRGTRSWKPSKMMVANQWDMDSQIEAEELKALTKAILTNSPSMANSIAADEFEKNNNREVEEPI
ncbi:hypothetical protein Droror1_Dr00015005 [Drosera rotundifolia]